MPLATIASAVSLISWAHTSQPKWFQLFQPVGGVRARPLSSGRPGDTPPRTTAMPRLMSIAKRANMLRYVRAVRRGWLAALRREPFDTDSEQRERRDNADQTEERQVLTRPWISQPRADPETAKRG